MIKFEWNKKCFKLCIYKLTIKPTYNIPHFDIIFFLSINQFWQKLFDINEDMNSQISPFTEPITIAATKLENNGTLSIVRLWQMDGRNSTNETYITIYITFSFSALKFSSCLFHIKTTNVIMAQQYTWYLKTSLERGIQKPYTLNTAFLHFYFFSFPSYKWILRRNYNRKVQSLSMPIMNLNILVDTENAFLKQFPTTTMAWPWCFRKKSLKNKP